MAFTDRPVGIWAGLLALAACLGVAWTAPGAASIPESDPSALQDSLAAAATFDSVWSRIRNTHWDPEMEGVDWAAARSELRPEALRAESADELRAVLNELLGRLGQSHFQLLPGSSGAASPSERPGGSDGRGTGTPGIELRWLDGDLLVSRVVPGSPAEDAGVRPGWILDEVDGVSSDSLAAELLAAPLDRREESFLRRWLPAAARGRLLGPAGTEVSVTLLDGEDRRIRRRIDRVEPAGELLEFGNLPPVRIEVSERLEALPGGGEAGVVALSAWFPSAVPHIARAVDRFRDADGIVLDLRGNPGGVGGLVMGVGGHFLDEPVSLGTMHTRQGALEFVVNPQRIAPDGRRVEPFDGPLAILVDPMTASTSEIFAGGLQALGRAVVVGETTSGQALPAVVVPLPNGDRLLHAVADFTAPDGARLEGRGVVPDVPVTLDRDALLREDDPALAEALRWLGEQ